MPPDDKPRWGWASSDKYFEEAEHRHASIAKEEILHLIPPREARDAPFVTARVKTALEAYYVVKFGDSGPTRDEIIAAMNAFQKATIDFAFCLENLDEYSRNILQRRFESYIEKHSIDEEDQEKVWDYYQFLFEQRLFTLGMLDFLRLALSTEDMNKPPKKKGRRPDIALIGLIGDLADIYENYTGKSAMEGFHFDAIEERYRGVIVEITEHLLLRFVPDVPIARNSVGDYVRRTLGDRADPRWQKGSRNKSNLPFPWQYDPMLPRFQYEINLLEPNDDGSIRTRTIRSDSDDE